MKKYQEVLARLYTDEEFREEFFNDREHVLASRGIHGELASNLTMLSKQQVESFAHGLVQKRLHEVRGLLPHTAKALGITFNKMFIRYAASKTVDGVHKHQEDAAAFAGYLFELYKSEVFLTELIRFERNRVLRYLSRRRVIAESYKCQPYDLLDCVQKHRQLHAKLKTILHVYYRIKPGSRFSRFKFSLPLGNFIFPR